jgi:hypothetical protein
MQTRCKFGDSTCPCQDGDVCHYVATNATPAWPAPLPLMYREPESPEDRAAWLDAIARDRT